MFIIYFKKRVVNEIEIFWFGVFEVFSFFNVSVLRYKFFFKY